MFAEKKIADLVHNFSDDPTTSYTLPGEYYVSREVFEAEKKSIFFHSWQFVCHVSRIRAPNSYYVHELLDQSVIVLRTKKGGLRAYHNVCQHRAHRLLEGNGTISGSIVCPYHSWNYNAEGKLTTARRTQGMTDFDIDKICLASVQVTEMAGLVFINMDPNAKSFEETYPGLEKEIREFCSNPEDLNFAYTKDYAIEANWKNSIENYAECYHCPSCHPSLSSQALDMGSYSITIHPNYHAHLSGDCGDDQGYPMREHGKMSKHFGAWFVWPNVCIEFYPGGYLNVLYHRPLEPEETVQIVEWYCADDKPNAEEQAVIDFVAITREEDLPICESVQRGFHSKGYSQGRFVVTKTISDHSEHAVHDIQRLTLKSLSEFRSDPLLNWGA